MINTYGLLLLGSVVMFLGIRFSSYFLTNVTIGIVGLLLVLLAGVFWISAAINWEKKR